MVGGLAIGYLFLMFIFFIIGVLILRWAFKINKIVEELEMIRKALVVTPDLEESIEVSDKIREITKDNLKEAKKAVDRDNVK